MHSAVAHNRSLEGQARLQQSLSDGTATNDFARGDLSASYLISATQNGRSVLPCPETSTPAHEPESRRESVSPDSSHTENLLRESLGQNPRPQRLQCRQQLGGSGATNEGTGSDLPQDGAPASLETSRTSEANEIQLPCIHHTSDSQSRDFNMVSDDTQRTFPDQSTRGDVVSIGYSLEIASVAGPMYDMPAIETGQFSTSDMTTIDTNHFDPYGMTTIDTSHFNPYNMTTIDTGQFDPYNSTVVVAPHDLSLSGRFNLTT